MKIASVVGVVGMLSLLPIDAYAVWPFASEVAPAAPVRPAAPETAASNPVPSRMFLTGFVPWERLQQELDAAAPYSETGTRGDPVGNPVVDDVLTWQINRTSIAIDGEAGAIRATTGLSGTVRLQGTVRLIRGDIGKLLGKLNPTNIPFSVHADLAAKVAATSFPVLAPNWRVAPNFGLSVDVTQADIPINHVGTISVRGLIRDEVSSKVAELQHRLEAKVGEDRFIEDAARKVFADACRITDFAVEGQERGWLVTRPVAFQAAQPVIDDSGLRIGLGLRATTEIGVGTRPADPECPFPETLEILPTLPDPDFELDVPAGIEWKDLTNLTNAAVAGRSWSAEEAGQTISLTVDRVAMSPFGESMLAEVDFSGRLSGWFGSRFDGKVYLTARPLLDAAAQKLRFVDVDLDVASGSALSATGLFGTLAAPLLEKAIAERAMIDLASYVADARSQADAAAAKLNAELRSDGLTVTHRLDTIELRQIFVAEDRLSVRIAAKGAFSVDLEALK
jgi:hypothetical protein